MVSYRIYQMWESGKPIYHFKGHSGDCGEYTLEVRVETDSGLEEKARIQTGTDDGDDDGVDDAL